MRQNFICPTDHITVSETRVRLTALFVFLIVLGNLFIGSWWIALLLVIDFFLRGFAFGRYSPLNRTSDWIDRKFFPPGRQIDRAPKLFAARLGFIFCDCLLIAIIFELTTLTLFISCVLLLFSFLEFALGFCAGCYVYSFLRKFFPGLVA